MQSSRSPPARKAVSVQPLLAQEKSPLAFHAPPPSTKNIALQGFHTNPEGPVGSSGICGTRRSDSLVEFGPPYEDTIWH